MSMRRILVLLLIICLLFLLGCDDNVLGSASIQARTYTNGDKGLDYSGWSNDTVKIKKQNMRVYENLKYNMYVIVSSVNANSVNVVFSYPVYCDTIDKNSDVFTLEKERTYTFATNNINGIEVKMRFK